ncbi:MAG: hypothetical protein IPH75_03115 [bacterium]|nr:hypothetical protein [bacterium]
MIYRLKSIENQTPVSRLLEQLDASQYSTISRGKPAVNGEQYFATFAEAESGEIAYFYAPDVSKWEEVAARLSKSPASLLILNSELSLFVRPQMNQCLLFCAQPKQLFADLVKQSVEQIEPTALSTFPNPGSVSPHAVIEAGASIGRNVTIESNCVIHGNVTIGDHVVIKAGAVIGGPGFEFYKDDQGALCHFPHSGRVVIEDNVYIGSGVVIDTAVFKQTIIRRGTKIDNLASIAHNVEIGENCLIMAHASIAGSVKIGPRTRVCLAASVRDGVTVGSDVVIGMSACVTKNIPDNVTAFGVPAVATQRSTKASNREHQTPSENTARTVRLIKEVVHNLRLDLTGFEVLTEAATGHFAVTAAIAALAGARVQAIATDSPYGSADDAALATLAMAKAVGVESRIRIVSREQADLSQTDILTNLGFVRPIDAQIVSRLKPGSVIPVMYDARELRPGEIDLDCCREREIHVVGTNEEHPMADILSYCEPLAVRLMMEQNLEIRGSHIVVAGENFFTPPILRALEQLGAEVTLLTNWNQLDRTLLESLDLLLYIDYWNQLGDTGGKLNADQLSVASGATVLQFIGGLDLTPFRDAGWRLAPSTPVAPHRMWRTLAYLGPRPVIELHAAGLKAAELEFRGEEYATGSWFDGLRQPIIAFRPTELTARP